MSDIVTLNGYKIKDEKAVRSYETVALMKADTKLKEGYHVKTKGYYEANDDGHSEYIIVNDDTLVDDGGSIHVLNNGLRAKLLISGVINVKQFGAYGDGVHDDTNAIIKALSMTSPIYVPKGTYIISQPLTIGGKILQGAGQYQTFIKTSSDFDGTLLTISGDHAKISDLTLMTDDYDFTVAGTTNTNTALDTSHHHITLSNLRILGFNTGFYAHRAWCLYLSNVMFMCCNTGLEGREEFNNILLTKCLFDYNVLGLQVNQGFGVEANACNFEHNTRGIEIRNLSDFNAISCYFENNTDCSVQVYWGTTYVRSVTLEKCSFWANDTVSTLIKYHTNPEADIILRDCVMRNNTNLTAGTIPIFTRTNDTLAKPHVIGCYIGESFSIDDRPYIDNLKPTPLTITDLLNLSEGVTVSSSCLYENNKHIWGYIVFNNSNGFPSNQHTIATFKDKYKPPIPINTFGGISDSEYSQTTGDICYLYLSQYGIAVGNIANAEKFVKCYIDYVIN